MTPPLDEVSVSYIMANDMKLAIEEIGTMVGFSQVYNFSRWFRIVTGTTPFRFRKGL